MKKVLITMAVLTGMVAGAMVFSSFAAPKQEVKSENSEIVLDDNGWEDWTKVTAVRYVKKDGEWINWSNWSQPLKNVQVQRREACGAREFRVILHGTPYAVSASPVDDYEYCFRKDGDAYCFDM